MISCSYNAWLSWNDEFNTMLNYMGCPYYYNIMQVRGSYDLEKAEHYNQSNPILNISRLIYSQT